jgi:hypothetical protein
MPLDQRAQFDIFLANSEREISAVCLRGRDVAGAMNKRTDSDGQLLAAKWRLARGRTTETRELPPPAAQSRGEGQRRPAAGGRER